MSRLRFVETPSQTPLSPTTICWPTEKSWTLRPKFVEPPTQLLTPAPILFWSLTTFCLPPKKWETGCGNCLVKDPFNPYHCLVWLSSLKNICGCRDWLIFAGVKLGNGSGTLNSIQQYCKSSLYFIFGTGTSGYPEYSLSVQHFSLGQVDTAV